MGQHADITRAVAQQRECFLGDGSEDQLALYAVRQHLTSIGVDDLGDEVVLIDVHACLFRALKGDTGPAQLSQAVDIKCLDTERILDALAHLLRPGLGAKNTGLQGDLVRGEPHFLHGLAQIGGVGRRAAEDGGLQIHDEHDLAFRIAAGGRDGQASDLVAAAVETGAAGKETVAVRDLADALIAAAGSNDRAGTAVFPQIDIGLRIKSYNTLAGGTAGGLDANAILEGCAHQAVGIGFAKVSLAQKRQLVQIFGTLDIIGRQALLFHLLTVIGYVFPDMPDLRYETLILESFQLLTGHGLDLRLEIAFSHKATPSFRLEKQIMRSCQGQKLVGSVQDILPGPSRQALPATRSRENQSSGSDVPSARC